MVSVLHTSCTGSVLRSHAPGERGGEREMVHEFASVLSCGSRAVVCVFKL